MITDKELFTKIINDEESRRLYRNYMVSGFHADPNRLYHKRVYEERKLYIFNLMSYLGITKKNEPVLDLSGGLTKLKKSDIPVQG